MSPHENRCPRDGTAVARIRFVPAIDRVASQCSSVTDRSHAAVGRIASCSDAALPYGCGCVVLAELLPGATWALSSREAAATAGRLIALT